MCYFFMKKKEIKNENQNQQTFQINETVCAYKKHPKNRC